MKGLVAPVVAVVLLSGCGDAPMPSVEPPFQVEINLHCGVDWQRFSYEGQTYHLEAKKEAETINPPPGWAGVEVTTVIEKDGQLLAIGPDGSERELVEVSGEEAEHDLCI